VAAAETISLEMATAAEEGFAMARDWREAGRTAMRDAVAAAGSTD